jgi:hypothetical protein
MAFLRNSYFLVNFGDFVLGTTNRAPPYIQLLSTTNDSAEAHDDFVTVRGSSTNSTSGHAIQASGTSRGSNNSNRHNNYFSAHAKLFYIIGACILGALALCCVLVCLCCRKRTGSSKLVYS